MSIKSSKFIAGFENNKIGLLLLAFILVHLTLLLTIGVQTGLEADKYVGEGTNLYLGKGLSEGKYVLYAPVILLVWACKSLHISILWIIPFQIALSAFSQYCFYRMVEKITNSNNAFICSLLLLICIPYQQWNLFLYSDSIFISVCLLLTYSIYRSSAGKGVFAILYALPMLALLLFSRPSGIFLILPFCIYFLLTAKNSLTRLVNGVIALGMLAFSYMGTNFVFRNSSDMNILIPYIEEHIICFVPTRTAGNSLEIVQTGNAVHDLWYYVTHNPSHFLKLMLLRLKSVFFLYRPYYGMLHNAYLLMFTGFIYVTGIVGIKRLLRMTFSIKYFFIALLIIYPLCIAIQCDDWHSRFVMILFPYLCLLSVLGLSQLNAKLSKS